MNVIVLLFTISATWLILYAVEKENLRALGFFPLDKRIIQLLTGLFIGTIACLVSVGLHTLLGNIQWIYLSITPASEYFKTLIYWLAQVVTIEFIFRGAFLYIMLKHLKYQKALLISALAFAVYAVAQLDPHKTFYPAGLAGEFFFELLFGYVLAYAFYRSGSILPPIGIHLSWLYVYALFYPSEPSGRLMFSTLSGSLYGAGTSPYEVYLNQAAYTIPPIVLIYLAVQYMLRKPKRIIYIDV